MSSSPSVEKNSSSYFFDSCLQLCALFIAFFIVAYKFILRFSARLFLVLFSPNSRSSIYKHVFYILD